MYTSTHVIFTNSMNMKPNDYPNNYSIQFTEFTKDGSEFQELPIDYSRRYSEIQNTLSFNFGFKHSNELGNNIILPKWLNEDNNKHVTNLNMDSKKLCVGNYKNLTKSPNLLNVKPLEPFDINGMVQNIFQNSSLIEQVDVPTNYSIQFTEYSEEENAFQEEPIDYSKRYSEIQSSIIKSKNESSEVNNIYNDSVKTFCTEDTPLNYLSVSVSMNDLHSFKDDFIKNQGMKESCQDIHYNNNIEKMKEKNKTDINYSLSQLTLLNADIYNYCENTNHSPNEKPKAFFTEDTPANFSRTSSPSDLLSEKNYLNQNFSKSFDDDKKDNYLPSIKEDETLKIISPINKLKNSDKVEANIGKSVKFDECQQTPMMFSRCSSLGSLSSFDIKSIHSSLISEYSRRASEVVSPSDLPDSPGDSFPTFVQALNANKINNTIINEKIHNKNFINDSIKNIKVKGILKVSENSSLIHYADEGTPPNNLSPKSNLSKISNIHLDNVTSRALPLGEENVCNLDESDDFKLSEHDELMVAECINMALPTKSIKNKSSLFSNKIQNEYSLSDNDDEYDDILLSEVIEAAMPKSKKQRNKSNVSNLKLTNITFENMPPYNSNLNHICSLKNKYNYTKLTNPNFQQYSFLEPDIAKNYAEEGTPIDFSRATSLSNLIVESGLNSRPNEEIVPSSTLSKSIYTNGSQYDDNEDEVVKLYEVEDTPAIFSCNDSISSLEDSIDYTENQIFNEVKPRIDQFLKSHLSLVLESNHLLYNSPIDKLNKIDKITYECGSNLSSTPIKDTYINTNKIIMGNKEFSEQLSSYNVENTPVHFSGESSLSSLSFGSNGADTSKYENDLLQECINAAMPKCKKKKSGKLKQLAACPSPNDTILNANRIINQTLNKRINSNLKPNKQNGDKGDVYKNNESMHEKTNAIDLDATEEDYFPSGPSTETNNTIIYKGIVSNVETSIIEAVESLMISEDNAKLYPNNEMPNSVELNALSDMHLQIVNAEVVGIPDLLHNSILDSNKDSLEINSKEQDSNVDPNNINSIGTMDDNEDLFLAVTEELSHHDISKKEMNLEPLSLSGLLEEFNRKRVKLRSSYDDTTMHIKSLSQTSSESLSSTHSSLHIDQTLFNEKEISKPHLKNKILSLFWKTKKQKNKVATMEIAPSKRFSVAGHHRSPKSTHKSFSKKSIKTE